MWLLYIIHVTGSFKDIFPSFLLKVSLTQGHENYGVFFKWLFQLKKILNYLRCYILSFVLSVTWATWQFTSSIPLGLFSSLLSSTLYIVLIWNCALGISYCYMLMFILCLLYVSHCRLGEGWALTNRFNPAINDIRLITLFVGTIQSSLLGVGSTCWRPRGDLWVCFYWCFCDIVMYSWHFSISVLFLLFCLSCMWWSCDNFLRFISFIALFGNILRWDSWWFCARCSLVLFGAIK